MMDGIDINAEYERIFGVKHRASLYDNDEQYAQFRQEIINSPAHYVNKDVLPFEKVKLLPYDEFLRLEADRGFLKRKSALFIRKI